MDIIIAYFQRHGAEHYIAFVKQVNNMHSTPYYHAAEQELKKAMKKINYNRDDWVDEVFIACTTWYLKHNQLTCRGGEWNKLSTNGPGHVKAPLKTLVSEWLRQIKYKVMPYCEKIVKRKERRRMYSRKRKRSGTGSSSSTGSSSGSSSNPIGKKSKKHEKLRRKRSAQVRLEALEQLYNWHGEPEFSGEFCPMEDPTSDMEQIKELCDTVGIEYWYRYGDDKPTIRYDKEQAVIREFLTSKAKQSLITALKALPISREWKDQKMYGLISNNVPRWRVRFEAAGVSYELTDATGHTLNRLHRGHTLKFDIQLLE